MAKKKTSVSEAFMDELYNIVANLDAKMCSDRVMAKMAAAGWKSAIRPTLRNVAIGGAVGAAAGAASADPEMRQSRKKRAVAGGLVGAAAGGLGGNAFARFRRRVKAYNMALEHELGLTGKRVSRIHKKSPLIRERMLEKARHFAERLPLYDS